MISKICKKRLIGDVRLLKKDPHEFIEAIPDDKNILLWYFLVKGPEFSDFSGGYYIGKIAHNKDYPLKPPDFYMLTPNGRFMIEQKICLSNSSYHSNEWSAMWNIKSILTGFLSIMLDDSENGISHIHSSKRERARMSKESIEYNKIRYPDLIKKFNRFLNEDGEPKKDGDDAESRKDNDVDEDKKDNEKKVNKNGVNEVNEEKKTVEKATRRGRKKKVKEEDEEKVVKKTTRRGRKKKVVDDKKEEEKNIKKSVKRSKRKAKKVVKPKKEVKKEVKKRGRPRKKKVVKDKELEELDVDDALVKELMDGLK